MKKLFILIAIIAFIFLCANTAFSQGVAINIDGSSADGSSMLDVKSTGAGILVPRLTQGQRNSIASPATGLLIFQTDNTPGFYYNAGTAGSPSWIKLSIPTDNFDDADADATNELQTISISDHDITLSDGGGTITVPDNNTTYSAGNQLGLTGTTFNVSEGSGSGLDGDMVDGQHYSDIQTWVNANDDNTTYSAGAGLTLTGTVFTPTFGTTAGTVSVGNHGHATLTRSTGLTGNNYDGSAAITWAVDFGSSALSGNGLKAQGNFGQFQPHATYTDFNTNPAYWGWNYVQGNTNAPNATSSQWYRQIISLGSDYPARGAGAYSLEMAFPRYNTSTAGVWVRTVENGTIGGWTRIDANGINYATLSGIPTRTAWSGVHRGFVAEQLSWKNYGNSHTIFDASAGTSPDGTAVNNTNSQVAWSATYPTLMGWNGVNTYGVRVDAARVSDNTTGNSATVGGLPAGSFMQYQGFTLDANTMTTNRSGFTYSVNAPFTGPIVFFDASNYGLQINSAYSGSGIGYRTRNGDAGTWNPWREFITTANVASYGDNLGNHAATTTLNMNGNVVTSFSRLVPYGVGGDSGQGNEAYAIFQEGGAWSHPYPDLRIAYHTGIKLGANPSYGGIKFYSDYDMVSLVMSVNDAVSGSGANNVYMAGNLSIGTTNSGAKLVIKEHTDSGIMVYLTDDNSSTGDLAHKAIQVQTQGTIQSWIATNGTGFFNGNVGVGTQTPSYKLHVTGDIYANGGWLRSSGDAGWYSETWGGGWHMSDAQWIRAYNNKDVYTAGSMRADAQVYTGGQNAIFKYTNVGQFNQAAGFAFSDFGVLIENAYAESGGFQANGNNANIWSPGDYDILRIYDEDGMVLKTYFDGNGTYYNPSDINKKQNIVKIEGALPKVLQLNGYNFEFKLHKEEIEKGQSPKATSGVIAQEVFAVMPEIVDQHDQDGMYVNYDGLIPYLIEAIKEQQVMIEDLQKQIDKLRQASEEKTE
jgi:hypothetical protein